MSNKPRKIGFLAQEDPDEKPAEENKLHEIISLLYKPEGETEEKDFKTSAEIAYELEEMVQVTPVKVSQALTELGYKFTNVGDQICYIVYSNQN